MLPPEVLDTLPDAFVALWREVEDSILRDAARRIGKMDALTETANWQLWRYQQTEAVRNNVVKLLARYSGKSERTIRSLLKEAATEAMEREDAIYYHYGLEPTPFEESATLNNLLDAGSRQTNGTWQNLTATTANTVTGAFERTLDAAWGKVSTGAFDYKTAVKQAVDSLADDLPVVTYPSGHMDSLDVVVLRATRTGINQTAGEITRFNADQLECDLMQLDAHVGARTGDGGQNLTNHSWWQGQIVSRSGKHGYLSLDDIGYGDVRGFMGANCAHNWSMYWEGASVRSYTPERLAAINAATVSYNGKEIGRYKATQIQRAQERQIRAEKRAFLVAKESGQKDTEKAAAAKLAASRDKLKDFLQQTGLKQYQLRESVPGFGRSEASSAAAQARK